MLTNLIKLFSREKFDTDLSLMKEGPVQATLSWTRNIIEGILARLDLLLHVNIAPGEAGSMIRSLSQCVQAIKTGKQLVNSFVVDLSDLSFM